MKRPVLTRAALTTPSLSPSEEVAQCGLDIPAFLKIPQAKRTADWLTKPPPVKPVFHAPRILDKAIAEARTRDSVPRVPKVKARKTPDRPSGSISIAQVAQSLKLDARLARRALRASELVKPAHGWAWPASEVPHIEKVITTWLKARSETPAKSSTPSKPETKSSKRATSSKATPSPERLSSLPRTTKEKASRTTSKKSSKSSGKRGRS